MYNDIESIFILLDCNDCNIFTMLTQLGCCYYEFRQLYWIIAPVGAEVLQFSFDSWENIRNVVSPNVSVWEGVSLSAYGKWYPGFAFG